MLIFTRHAPAQLKKLDTVARNWRAPARRNAAQFFGIVVFGQARRSFRCVWQVAPEGVQTSAAALLGPVAEFLARGRSVCGELQTNVCTNVSGADLGEPSRTEPNRISV